MEQWKSVIGYEGFYEVSDHGRVRSLGRVIMRKNGSPLRIPPKVKAQCEGTHGYMVVSLSTEGITTTHCVHRLVAEAFIPNPDEKRCVNHINEVKTDNRLFNLEWATQSENFWHSYDNEVH